MQMWIAVKVPRAYAKVPASTNPPQPLRQKVVPNSGTLKYATGEGNGCNAQPYPWSFENCKCNSDNKVHWDHRGAKLLEGIAKSKKSCVLEYPGRLINVKLLSQHTLIGVELSPAKRCWVKSIVTYDRVYRREATDARGTWGRILPAAIETELDSRGGSEHKFFSNTHRFGKSNVLFPEQVR
eukprot:6480418-Amphidinium_carterae.1